MLALDTPPGRVVTTVRRLSDLGSYRESHAIVARASTHASACDTVLVIKSKQHVRIKSLQQHSRPALRQPANTVAEHPAHYPTVSLLPRALRAGDSGLPHSDPHAPLRPLPATGRKRGALLPACGAHQYSSTGLELYQALPATTSGVAVRPPELCECGQLGSHHQQRGSTGDPAQLRVCESGYALRCGGCMQGWSGMGK